MRLEELTRLDICPFDQGVLSDSLSGDETEKEQKAHFILMLRYLALFVEQCQLPFSVPRLNVTLERQSLYKAFSSPFKETKVAMIKQLFEEVMLGSGWSYGICGLKKQKWEARCSCAPYAGKGQHNRLGTGIEPGAGAFSSGAGEVPVCKACCLLEPTGGSLS